MMIVDSHCHAGTSWFEPIELLVSQMDSNDVDRGVLIQHRGMYDNDYLLESAERFPGRFSVVAIVDTVAPDAPAALERWASRGAVGVRLAPTARSPGPDPLAIWRKAAELGLAVSSLGALDEFASDEFSALVSALPDLPIVIEHLAGATPGDEPPYTAFESAMALANAPNTYVKVGGLGEFADTSRDAPERALVRERPAAGRDGLRRLRPPAHDVGKRLPARERPGGLPQRSSRNSGAPSPSNRRGPRVGYGPHGLRGVLSLDACRRAGWRRSSP